MPDGARRLSRLLPDWRAGITPGPREDAYRHSGLPADLRQSRFIVAVATLAVLVSNLADLWLDALGPASVGRLWLFGLLGTLTLVTWLVLDRIRTPRGFDLVMLAWLSSFFGIALAFRITGAPLTTSPVLVFLALGGYTLVPHRILFRAVPVFALTVADLGIVAGLRAEAPHEVWSLGLVYMFVHLAGGWVALDRESDRRHRFRARLAEDDARRQLEHLANVDALTGALSRRYWLELAEAESARFERHRRSFAVLMADLDRFKAVNDRHGHQAGDEVLKEFVRLLQAEQRRNDAVGRLGGEEFAVLLPETAGPGAREMAERIVAACRRMVVAIPGGEVRITCSIGVAVVREGDTVATLLHRADLAMLAAKEQGRDRVEVAPA
jgi:diguanylate cyclase (GGDEF)-like protein